MFTCNEDETRLLQPKELQDYIDLVVSESNKTTNNLSRCFVRASGTEDAIRVYSESREIKEAISVLSKVEEFIKEKYS